jgi:hypothetical protein
MKQQRHAVGSSKLPSREVQPPLQENLQSPVIDHSVPAEQETQICVLMEDSNMPKDSLEAILNAILAKFLENKAAIFTCIIDPMNPR